MKIKSSKHSKHSLGYHIIFCPKYRHQVLTGPIEVELKKLITEICLAHEWELHALEVMPDHVHMFVQADHNIAPVNIAKTIKSITAVYLFQNFPTLKRNRFWGSGLWSRGTFYSSVGHISEEVIKRYIEEQKFR